MNSALEINNDNQYRWVTGGKNIKDMIIQIDGRVERSSSDGDFGVICRYQDDNNLYMFEVTQDSYYAIYKLFRGDWYPLIDFTLSDMLINLKDAQFKAACIGDTLSFAVNGKILGEVSDQSFKSGDFGFFAGTYEISGNIVSFDNLIVSQP